MFYIIIFFFNLKSFILLFDRIVSLNLMGIELEINPQFLFFIFLKNANTTLNFTLKNL